MHYHEMVQFTKRPSKFAPKRVLCIDCWCYGYKNYFSLSLIEGQNEIQVLDLDLLLKPSLLYGDEGSP